MTNSFRRVSVVPSRFRNAVVRGHAAGFFGIVMLLSGCGLPTWTELTGGKKQEIPLQNPNPPQPVVTPIPAPPPQPKPPSDEQIIAAFQAKKPFELDDTALLDLAKANEGLEVVEDVNLNGSKVTNGGLTHLAKLPNLKRLDVRNSPVDKDGASAIGALASLEVLKLDGGEMNDAAVQALNPISGLKELEISNVRLSPGGWAQLATHKNLETLYILRSNINDSTMEILGELKSLKVLWINDVAVSDRGLVQLKGLDHLERLNLAGTAITGEAFGAISKGKGLKGLKELGLEGTPLNQRGANGIKTMSQLERLGLGGMSQMRDQDFVPMVKPLKNLKSINLSNCKGLTGGAFMAFVGNEDIEEINANGCEAIDDSGLRHLVKCKSLKKLNLSGSRCTLNGVQALRRVLSDLEVDGFGPLGTSGGSSANGR